MQVHCINDKATNTEKFLCIVVACSIQYMTAVAIGLMECTKRTEMHAQYYHLVFSAAVSFKSLLIF